MKQAVGIAMGLLGGFLIYMMLALTIGPDSVGPLFVLTTFVGGWVLSSLLIIRGAKTVSKVFSRGFLLGAALWLGMIPVGLVMSGKALSENVTSGSERSAEQAGAALGAGCITFITGAFSVGMAVVCLIGFAISYFIGREMKPEVAAATRRCPECAELIQQSARRCRHCGAVLVSDAPAGGGGAA